MQIYNTIHPLGRLRKWNYEQSHARNAVAQQQQHRRRINTFIPVFLRSPDAVGRERRVDLYGNSAIVSK